MLAAMPTIVSILMTVSYAYLLVFIATVVLALFSRLFGALLPSARVAIGVFEAASQRMLILGGPSVGWTFILVPVLLIAFGYGQLVQFPPSGSLEREFGDNAATLGVFLWIGQGLSFAAGSGVLYRGMKQTDPAFKVAKQSQYLLLVFLGFGPLMYVLFHPGPLASFGIVIAVACGVAFQYHGLHLLAVIRRNRAPRAAPREPGAPRRSPYAAQISDVHVCMPDTKLVQGGKGGNAQLDHLVRHWTTDPAAAPTVVLVTGDLIDRGLQREWEIAVPVLQKLRACGIRVVLAPGNHDLATAYYAGAGHFMAHSWRSQRFVDTARIKAYLRYAAELDPTISCWDWRPVLDALAAEEAKFATFITSWRSAAATAVSELQGSQVAAGVAKSPSPRALALLAARSPALANGLIDPLVDAGMALFSFGDLQLRKDRFRRALTMSAAFELPPMLERSARWVGLWYGSFPLRLVDEARSVEFLIVNSNAPEPGLVGSGFGYLGVEQVERLRQCAKVTKARSLVVLMHHAVCGWADEKADRPGMVASVERWAFLAHETAESHAVLELLAKEPPLSCERVLLCCGHRHGPSKAGRVVDPATDSGLHERLTVMESAALPDLSFETPQLSSARAMLGLAFDEAGCLKPCAVEVT